MFRPGNRKQEPTGQEEKQNEKEKGAGEPEADEAEELPDALPAEAAWSCLSQSWRACVPLFWWVGGGGWNAPPVIRLTRYGNSGSGG